MNIIVNGQPCNCQAGNLSALLQELDYGGAIVATAVNGDFVAEPDRETTEMKEGDKVEILAPMKGG